MSMTESCTPAKTSVTKALPTMDRLDSSPIIDELKKAIDSLENVQATTEIPRDHESSMGELSYETPARAPVTVLHCNCDWISLLSVVGKNL